MNFLQNRHMGLVAALLLASTTAAAQVTFDCQTTQEKMPGTGLTPNPKAVATVPLDKQRLGYVRVGGGCEVSRFGFDSVHAAVMVQNAPDGEFGWRCKGADPALISNPAWAKASVTYCKASDPSVSSLKLQCTKLSKKTGPARNPSAEVTLTQALIDDGYTVVSGGCDSSHFMNGSTHAENVVISKPSATGKGWFCQAADPPNNGQDATVEASLVACKVAIDPAQAAALNPKPALRCSVTQGTQASGVAYPKSIVPAPAQVLGGGCALSYASNGSAHAEFMVQHGPQNGSWACLAADPPLISNPGSALASAISCSITSAPPPPPPPATAQKNPVLIVGGTLASEIIYWVLEGRLRADGYSVEFFELPGGGLVDIKESARQLKYKIADMQLRTGAEKINVIAHSQGGIVARSYIHDFGASTIESLVSLGTPHQGAIMEEGLLYDLMGTFLFQCYRDLSIPSSPFCYQIFAGTPLIQEINQRDPADAIFYTNLMSRNDVFTKPDVNGKMTNCDRTNAAGETLQCNVVIQDFCPTNLVEHVGLASNGAVYSGIRQALAHKKIALNCLEL